MASEAPKLKPLAKACVQDPKAWLRDSAVEIREHMATLGAAGWSLWDIAAALSCSRTSLWSWRTGASDMPASKFRKLRALAAEVAGRKASGT